LRPPERLLHVLDATLHQSDPDRGFLTIVGEHRHRSDLAVRGSALLAILAGALTGALLLKKVSLSLPLAIATAITLTSSSSTPRRYSATQPITRDPSRSRPRP
jgi:hypothetical protein